MFGTSPPSYPLPLRSARYGQPESTPYGGIGFGLGGTNVQTPVSHPVAGLPEMAYAGGAMNDIDFYRRGRTHSNISNGFVGVTELFILSSLPLHRDSSLSNLCSLLVLSFHLRRHS